MRSSAQTSTPLSPKSNACPHHNATTRPAQLTAGHARHAAATSGERTIRTQERRCIATRLFAQGLTPAILLILLISELRF